MRRRTIWAGGLVTLAACGGSLSTARTPSHHAELCPLVATRSDALGVARLALNVPSQKPLPAPKTRDGDTAGIWWPDAKNAAPFAKR